MVSLGRCQECGKPADVYPSTRYDGTHYVQRHVCRRCLKWEADEKRNEFYQQPPDTENA